MKDVLKPPQRRATKTESKKPRWVRPETIQLATFVLKLVTLFTKLIGFLHR